MILGIGTDISSIERIKQASEKHGDKFLDKYFTIMEIEYIKSKSDELFYQSIGSSWAIKEATVKAIGTGISNGVAMKDISLSHDSKGAPVVNVSNGAEKKIESLSGGKKYRILASISHDMGIVQSFVIIETE